MTITGKRLDFPSPPRRKPALGAWPAFERKLAEALDVLEEDQFLVITEKSGWAYVQFAGQGSFGVRAECVSNNYLDEAHALRADQMTALERIGWSAPTGTPAEASPKRQPEGSPNFFRDFDRPVPYDAVARMAVRSLAGVFEIPHPGYLHYKAFDKSKRSILIPTLGLMREPPAPPRETPSANTIEGLRDLVLKAVRKASGNADLEFTEDGDVPQRFGSAAVRLRVLDNPPCVRMFSPMLEDVEAGDRLLSRLNELNAEIRFARFFVLDGTVFAVTEMFASPFVAEHVASACLQLGSLADKIGGTLQKEFGGRTAFEDARDEPEVQ
jgi:hypothetical protein